MRDALPIDVLLPEVTGMLARTPSLVIEAPPGAGKTTRVPAALLDESVADGEVWVLEPRRLPTRMAARRVAEERGERVGESVGYQVRFEDATGPRTRLRFLTEGVFTRRLLTDPTLRGVGAIVLDEFHERHLQTDVALALLRRLQRESRPDLRIVVMSATLESEPIARFLHDCPVLVSEGRRFAVHVEHLARPDERPLAQQVESAVRRLLSEGLDGDVLVFLPGAAEIRRATEACAALAEQAGLLLLPLHGELSVAEQERAVRPADRRKVILSTNVAETSVTIEGVAAVVDSGLARVAGHSVWSGLPTLVVGRVSQSSAVQRAGRAGRTREGRALRLYTAQDFAARPLHDAPEVQRLDLAGAVLELHAAGIADLRSFEWFEAPDAQALEAAEALLGRLGAIETSGGRVRVTETGEAMLRLPLHPRLARLVVEGERRGVGREACVVAALTSERDIRAGRVSLGDAHDASATRQRRTAAVSGPSDLLELFDLFAEAERAGFAHERLRRMNLDAFAVRAVERVSGQLQRLMRSRRASPELTTEQETQLLISILAGYPDRVARRRTSASGDARGRDEASAEVLLAGGGVAELAAESVVRAAEFLVAVEAEERSRVGVGSGGRRRPTTLVRLASAIEPDWLLDLFADALTETTEVRWNAQDERVETATRLLYDQLVLDERTSTERRGADVSKVLAEAVSLAGAYAFVEREAVERFLARVEFVANQCPDAGFAPLGEEDVRAALVELCEGRRSFAELREAVRAGEFFEALRRKLTGEQTGLLARLAPERVGLAGGRQVRVNYERGKPPWIASRLQDFFRMKESPRVAAGRVPVVMHLLAPNNRPVQVTSDLAGFWERHYPQVRRELSRRYPRHAWPENPLRADTETETMKGR